MKRNQLAQFVNLPINTGQMFFGETHMSERFGPDYYGLGQSFGPDYYGLGDLGQNRGGGTFGPEFLGSADMDRYFGHLGQSSVDEGYANEEQAEAVMGLGAGSSEIEAAKMAAVQAILPQISVARNRLNEAGRPDLVPSLDATATLFQARITSASTVGQVQGLVDWFVQKVAGLMSQARSGAASSSNGGPASRTRASSNGDIVADPVEENGGGNMNFLVIGGVALAAIGVYLLMQEG